MAEQPKRKRKTIDNYAKEVNRYTEQEDEIIDRLMPLCGWLSPQQHEAPEVMNILGEVEDSFHRLEDERDDAERESKEYKETIETLREEIESLESKVEELQEKLSKFALRLKDRDDSEDE
jgi:archaellum component FlaC